MQIKQLRILATVLLGFAVAQAGLGSGFLNDEARGLLIAHRTNAFAVLVLTILAAVFGFNYRRSGGPGWAFFLPLVMVGMVGLQISLGVADVRGAHVFCGVLYLCVATAYCSYTWRYRPADKTQGKAPSASTG